MKIVRFIYIAVTIVVGIFILWWMDFSMNFWGMNSTLGTFTRALLTVLVLPGYIFKGDYYAFYENHFFENTPAIIALPLIAIMTAIYSGIITYLSYNKRINKIALVILVPIVLFGVTGIAMYYNRYQIDPTEAKYLKCIYAEDFKPCASIIQAFTSERQCDTLSSSDLMLKCREVYNQRAQK